MLLSFPLCAGFCGGLCAVALQLFPQVAFVLWVLCPAGCAAGAFASGRKKEWQGAQTLCVGGWGFCCDCTPRVLALCPAGVHEQQGRLALHFR